MMFAPSPGSPLQALAMKWQMLAVMLVALAREVSLAHRLRAGAGVPKAELLESDLEAANAMRAALAGKPALYSQAVIRPRPSAPPFLDSG